MKKSICVFLLIAAANGAAVAAESEYDYPPEFADLIGQARLITPEEVKTEVALNGDSPWHDYAGALLLDPILVKSFNRTPAYYMIIGYKGDDKATRTEMENIIGMLNDDDGFNPYDIAERISSIESAWGDFYTFYRPAWTNGVGLRMASTYFPKTLFNFPGFLSQIESYRDITDVNDFKIYASDYHVGVPVLCYGDSVSDPRYFLVEMMTEVTPAERAELDENFSEWVSRTQESFDVSPGRVSDEIGYWRNILNGKNEIEKEGTYYKVREREEPKDDEVDGSKIDNVPDFNQNGAPHDQGSPDCWAWSMVSNLVYYSQKSGAIWGDYKDPNGDRWTPGFDDETSWGAGTWHFGDFVYYSLYYAAVYKGLASKYITGNKVDCTLFIADYCTECEGWKGENNEPKWKYWLGSPFYRSEYNDVDISCTHENLSYSEIQNKIAAKYPLSTHWFDYPLLGQHAVPTWGWFMDGSKKMLRTYDLHPPAYVEVNDVEHYETKSGGIPLAGLHCYPPQGADTGPWVCNFDVKKGWGQAELAWEVFTTCDVKGFNVFREDGNGELHKLNKEMIKHARGDPFTYKYIDKDYEKGQPYVLELVRYTPDDVQYLVHEREITR